jgi:hypothetical protein
VAIREAIMRPVILSLSIQSTIERKSSKTNAEKATKKLLGQVSFPATFLCPFSRVGHIF